YVDHLAILGKSDSAGGLDGAPNIFALNVAGPRTQGDAAAAIDTADVSSSHTDHRGFHRHTDNRLRFLDSTPNRADGQVEIHDLALSPSFGFSCAEGGELHTAVVFHLTNQGAGLGASNVQRHNMPFFLSQMLLLSRMPSRARRGQFRRLPPGQGNRDLIDNGLAAEPEVHRFDGACLGAAIIKLFNESLIFAGK